MLSSASAMLGGHATKTPPAHLPVVHAAPGPLPSVHLPQQHLKEGRHARQVTGRLYSRGRACPTPACLHFVLVSPSRHGLPYAMPYPVRVHVRRLADGAGQQRLGGHGRDLRVGGPGRRVSALTLSVWTGQLCSSCLALLERREAERELPIRTCFRTLLGEVAQASQHKLRL